MLKLSNSFCQVAYEDDNNNDDIVNDSDDILNGNDDIDEGDGEDQDDEDEESLRMLVLRRMWMMRTVVLRMRADLDWCFSWPGLEACRRPFWLDVADPGGEG